MAHKNPSYLWLNGALTPWDDATIHVSEMGWSTVGAVFEGIRGYWNAGHGELYIFRLREHLERLQRSLRELGIAMPMPAGDIVGVQRTLMERNNLRDGLIYMQITRGAADRNFDYADDVVPGFFAFTQARDLRASPALRDGIRVAILEDQRWARRDIKTTMLLAQVQAKREAKRQGCAEAWLVQDGLVTEGASSTAYIVTGDRRVVTRENSRMILPGCTRRAVLEVADRLGLSLEERAFSVEEALAAQEAFLTSASSLVTPVVEIAGNRIGDGNPGPVTRLLQETYSRHALGSEPDRG